MIGAAPKRPAVMMINNENWGSDGKARSLLYLESYRRTVAFGR